MRKPQPADFGLTNSDVAGLDRLDEEIAPKLLGWGILGGAGIGFAAGLYDGESAEAFIFALSGAAAGFLVGGLAVALWMNIASLLSPRIRVYHKFKAALQTFNYWDLRTRQEFWRSLSGRSFERELARLFQLQDYEVKLTPASGDSGVDIILRRSGKTTVVQCKQVAKPVGPAIVRELYGALISLHAHDAILASTGGVTRGVREFVSDKPIRLMDLSDIIGMHRRLEPQADRLLSG